jgi:hypothetical protein
MSNLGTNCNIASFHHADLIESRLKPAMSCPNNSLLYFPLKYSRTIPKNSALIQKQLLITDR